MSELLRAIVDGAESTTLSVLDRGLHFGDGVFRTILVKNGRPLFLEHHLRKLSSDCERLHLLPDLAGLESRARGLTSNVESGKLKIIVTRGEHTGGYVSRQQKACEILLLMRSQEESGALRRQNGVRLRVCSTILSANASLAGIKHLNRLEQVLARAEWDTDEFAEGLMLDSAGHVIEGTRSNLFLVYDGALQTPDLSSCGVAGVMRELVLEAAASDGIPVSTGRYNLNHCMGADEMFICNSVIGIWPTTFIEGREWVPGPVTRRLQTHFPQFDGPFS